MSTQNKTATGEGNAPLAAHTPGRWFVRLVYPGTLQVEACPGDGLRSIIARSHAEHLCGEHGGSTFANAYLIAAAPELLEALKFARNTIEIWHGEVAWPEYQSSPEMKMINSAIARAEGRAQ